MKRQPSARHLLDEERFTRRQYPRRQARRHGGLEYLPDFDTGRSTRVQCIVAVAVGAFLAIACLGLGIGIVVTQPRTLGAPVKMSSAVQEVISLVINIGIALCTDGMAFVHAVSLRWALYREGRLEWNTNIRLLTSAKKGVLNSWYMNILVLFCLVLSYAASSVLFLGFDPAVLIVVSPDSLSKCPDNNEDCYPNFLVSGTAFIALGVGLAGQAAVAIGCLLSASRTIPSWSSSPLNTTLAAIRQGRVTRAPGRCMMPVHDRTKDAPPEGTYPRAQQEGIFRAHAAPRYLLMFLGGLAVLAVAWPIAVAVVAKSIGEASQSGQGINGTSPCWAFGFDWNGSEGACSRNMVTLSMSPAANTHSLAAGSFPYGVEAILTILFVCLVQGVQTVALHCVELLVNMSRDEAIWRHAAGIKGRVGAGARLITGSFSAAAMSWENGILFGLKAILHWVVGQSLLASVTLEETGFSSETLSDFPFGFQFQMAYPRLLVYAIVAIFLALFASYLAFKRPRGCLPAAMGHVQTLADLIDDWDVDYEGRLWWGDKTGLLFDEDEIRHAGTCGSSSALAPIYMDARYAGTRRPWIS